MTKHIGVARIFDWGGGGGGANHKSHGRHQNFSKRGFSMGLRYHRMEDQKQGPGLACNLDLAEKKELESKLKTFPNFSKLGGNEVSKLV